MKNKIISALVCLLATGITSAQVVVHSKSDKRLLAYQDSARAYNAYKDLRNRTIERLRTIKTYEDYESIMRAPVVVTDSKKREWTLDDPTPSEQKSYAWERLAEIRVANRPHVIYEYQMAVIPTPKVIVIYKPLPQKPIATTKTTAKRDTVTKPYTRVFVTKTNGVPLIK